MPVKYKNKLKYDVALNKLEQFIDRVNFWNKNYAQYYRVEEVFLVGSMARNESKVGDIDLCVRTERAKIFSKQVVRDEYIEWRETELGYAPPRDYGGLLSMFERDVLRFIKNRDGRIEILQWDQITVISLTMKPIVKLVSNGLVLFKSTSEAIANAKPIPKSEAMEIIAHGVPEKPDQEKGIYWESYCESLNNYPVTIRKKILDRDLYEKHNHEYKKAPEAEG